MSETQSARKVGRPRSLTREAVLEAALDVGFENLSMPTVAARLGVSHSTLYRYVADRDDLVVGATGLVVERGTWPETDLSWREMLEIFAASLWDLTDCYPGLALAVMHLPALPPEMMTQFGRYVTVLRTAGFAARDAVVAVDMVADLVMTTAYGMATLDEVIGDDAAGHTRRDIMRAEFSAHISDVPELMDEDTWQGHGWFDHKLAILLDGLALRRSVEA